MIWHTEVRKISELKNWEGNPRTISEESYKTLKKSIGDLGNFEPLVINIDGTVLAGNQRLRVHKEQGDTEVEVSVPERELTEEEIKKIGIISNRHSGEWDMDKLANEFEDVLEELGFDDLMPEVELDVKEDDYEEPEDLEVRVKLGEVWQLGKHRLMCGDSTKIEDVEKLMNGQKATLAFNDPPYGMKKENEGVLNDNLNYEDLLDFNREWIALQFTYLKDNGSWYCWGIAEPLMDIYSHILKPHIKENKVTFRNWITWDKYSDNPTMRVNGLPIDGFRMFYPSSEFCLFVMMGVQGFNTNQDNYYEAWEPIRQYLVDELEKSGLSAKDLKPYIGDMYGHYFTKSQWTIPTEEKYEALRAAARNQAFKKDYEAIKKDYYATRAFFDNQHEVGLKDTWRYSIDDNKEMSGVHATPKPIELCARAIKSSCPEGEITTDWFGGSGSTLIACEQTNRVCYMMELDEHYCTVILDRWEKLTGEQGVKLED